VIWKLIRRFHTPVICLSFLLYSGWLYWNGDLLNAIYVLGIVNLTMLIDGWHRNS
jgi:hypothetical protein